MKYKALFFNSISIAFLAIFFLTACDTKTKEEVTTKNTKTAAENKEALKQLLKYPPEKLNLNPAHGQPGHRCDIEVGAPLNGVTNTSTNSVIPSNQNQTIQSNETLPFDVNSTQKTNPAHGQPGHRCDVAVGAPL